VDEPLINRNLRFMMCTLCHNVAITRTEAVLVVDPSTAFVSYSREDSEFVLRLVKDLKARGAKVWMDKLDIRPGQRWEFEIEEALNGCSRMLLILSPASVGSRNVLAEAAFAIDEGKEIIPVLHLECKIPLRLRPYQYADFRENYDEGLQGLLSTMGSEQAAAAETRAVTANAAPYLRKREATQGKETARKAGQDPVEREKGRTIGHQRAAGRHRTERARQARLVSASVEWKRRDEPDPNPRRWVVYVDNGSDAPITVEKVKVSSASKELSIEDWGTVRPNVLSDYELEVSDFNPSSDRPEVCVRFIDSYGRRWTLDRGMLKAKTAPKAEQDRIEREKVRTIGHQGSAAGHTPRHSRMGTLPRVLPLGDWLDEFRKTDLFTFFHLQQTDSIKDAAQRSTVIFKPTAQQFRPLVTMKVSIDEDDNILGMELVIARSFLKSQDSPFARDIAASFLKLAIPRHDIGKVEPLVRAVRSHDDPGPYQSAYKTFSGTQRVYGQKLAESRLHFENLNVSETESLVISVALREFA